MGFGAKIDITAKAEVGARVKFEARVKVEMGKFLTAIRDTNNNIENFDINNLAAGLIALIGLKTLPDLIILTDLIFVEKGIIKVIKVLLGCRVVVAAIRFSYFFISF